MFKRIFNSKLTLLLIILIAGCAAYTKYGKLEKSARQNFELGKYDTAFHQCASSLKVKPSYGKAQDLIQDAFRLSVNTHKQNIEQLNNSSSKFKWDQVVDEYELLKKINQTVQSLPALIHPKTKQAIVLETENYSENYMRAKQNAAQAHYLEGDRLSNINNLDSQKQAAKEFKQAQFYISGYKDADTRYEVCRKAGIKRVAIIPFENLSGKSEFGAVEEMITDDVISNVINDPDAMEFLEIISRDQLMQVMNEQQLGLTGALDEQTAVQIGKVLGVHELVTGKITQIIPTPARTTSNTYSEEKEVADHQETYIDSKGKKRKKWIYVNVSAVVNSYEKKANASINGSYKIVDVGTARVKKSESFQGNGMFWCEWGTFRGDKRALSSKSEALASKREQYAPTDAELVNEAARDLGNKLAETLKDYAK